MYKLSAQERNSYRFYNRSRLPYRVKNWREELRKMRVRNHTLLCNFRQLFVEVAMGTVKRGERAVLDVEDAVRRAKEAVKEAEHVSCEDKQLAKEAFLEALRASQSVRRCIREIKAIFYSFYRPRLSEGNSPSSRQN